MKKNERLKAHTLLTQLVQHKTHLSHLMTINKDLSPLTKDICFGVCRYYIRLEKTALQLVKKKPKSLDVWVCLLMGLYQIEYQHKPDYAVVKETVSLLDKLKLSWAKGLVNAVLRNYCRQQETLKKALEKDASYQYNHPEWFVARLKSAWTSHWQTILKANDAHPPMSLRVHRQHQTTTEYLQKLEEANLPAHPLLFSPDGIALEKPCDVHSLPGFLNGEVSVQDEAAQLAVSLLHLKPGLRVLDACCAPGGKTAHILEAEPNLQSLLAIDVDKKRLQRVEENMVRLQLNPQLSLADALQPQQFWDNRPFDRILLDAPCSATGVIRRHPDIKLLREESDVLAIETLQAALLKSLWPLLAENGLLVYATCSIMPEENAQRIESFLKTQADCHLWSTQDVPWGINTGFGWQILPGFHNMDGFFYSVLKKVTPKK